MARLGQLPMHDPQRAQSSVSIVNGMWLSGTMIVF
jgi:hypothetical protein